MVSPFWYLPYYGCLQLINLEIKKSYAHKIREGGQEKSITIFCPSLELLQYLTTALDVSLANDSVLHYFDMSITK